MSRRNRRLLRIAAPISGALLALLSAAPSQAIAQEGANEWLEQCRRSGNDSRAVHCEVRESTLGALPALDVNARPNGGIVVRGSDRSDIRVEARLRTQAASLDEAKALASQVRIQTAGGTILASGPESRGERQWSVNYAIEAPRQIDLTLQTVNGGLAVDDVRGDLELGTTNGGISLEGVGGNVRGQTTNGGLRVALAGDQWVGEGLDLRTTNGGISIAVPRSYSARLVTSTVNGRVNTDLPLTVQGQVGRQIDSRLGQGGATLRLGSTNGGIRIEQRN